MPASRHATALCAYGLPSAGVRGVAALCALLVWMLGLLATCPDLHAALHGDADHADHACAVTLFSHGTEACTPDAMAVSAPALRATGTLLPVAAKPASSALDRLPPACGPPVR